MENYELVLTSYRDCDDFVVEIWLQDNLLAVVKENGETQLFSDEVKVESDEFVSVLNLAKEKLGIE